MNLYLLQQYQFIQNLYKNESYLDVLMNIDDFFDILNIYAFPNWFDAEVVDMKVMKHFTNIILKQPRDKMPDIKGSAVLSKYNCIVKYKETTEWLPKVDEYNMIKMAVDEKTGKEGAKMEEKEIVLVDVLVPNNLIINDDVYDIENIQDKLDDEEENNDELESVVDNNEDLAVNNQQQAPEGM